MKFQGTDGLSRGTINEGIGLTGNMLAFCPWHLDALQRSEPLKEWIRSWAGHQTEFLEPSDWFVRGHDISGYHKDERGFWRAKTSTGTMVWSPPPAAGFAALEELRKARIKRQASIHIIVIPKLMTTLWLKQFRKTVDFLFVVKPDTPIWSKSQFEPLFIGICFPYCSCFPW